MGHHRVERDGARPQRVAVDIEHEPLVAVRMHHLGVFVRRAVIASGAVEVGSENGNVGVAVESAGDGVAKCPDVLGINLRLKLVRRAF